MRIDELNWMQVEGYLERDDRIVLPLGSTEQHAYLSLGTDSILAERISVEAAEPLGVPVLPVMPYGLVPSFAAFPGSPSLTEKTYAAVVLELLASLHAQGFRRFLLVNGHGGNVPAAQPAAEWAAGTGAQVLFHDWWSSERVRPLVEEIDPEGSHASWTENFPWTRLAAVRLPTEHKPRLDVRRDVPPSEIRAQIGDGSFGGWYERPDEEMLRIWQAGVEEARELLASGWSS
ncbi:MAG: creatininase family protein [Thermoleophilia bacterium]